MRRHSSLRGPQIHAQEKPSMHTVLPRARLQTWAHHSGQPQWALMAFLNSSELKYHRGCHLQCFICSNVIPSNRAGRMNVSLSEQRNTWLLSAGTA